VLAATPIVDSKAAVRKALDAAEADGDAAAMTMLRPLRPRAVERELAIVFATTKELPRRRSALRMLSELGTPASLPLLSRAAADLKFTALAMPGVARLGGTDTVLALTRAAQSDVRREAISELLKFDDDRAVSEFLTIVLDDARRGDALAALHGAPAPPVERFIANLEHPQVDRRFAAAKALGSMCDRTDVGLTLRRMVDQNDRRREALAALLSCPSPKAATFINAARARTSSIDAEVRAVQTELQRIF
jgi:HEAT repeat protein